MQGRSLLGNDHRQFGFFRGAVWQPDEFKDRLHAPFDSYKLLVYGNMQDCVFMT